MAAGKMEENHGAFFHFVRLITLVNICGGAFAAEEGHGPTDINFVTEEGESDIGAARCFLIPHCEERGR